MATEDEQIAAAMLLLVRHGFTVSKAVEPARADESAAPPDERLVSTVAEFCASNRISRTHFYELVKAGQGPQLMKVGRRTLISAEAAAHWRAAMQTKDRT